MRVFRKRQLRLREGDGKTLRIYGNPGDVSGSTRNAGDIAKQVGSGMTVTFPQTGSSSNGEVNYNKTGALNISDVERQQKKAFNDDYGFNVTVDGNGNTSGRTDNNSETNESRFSGNLIEGAVMFSKKELRDFLKRI